MGGPVVPVYGSQKPEWLSDHFLWAYSVHERDESDSYYVFPDHPLGVNMTFDKKMLRTLRFDEKLGRKGTNLISWEESKFFRELMRQGGQVVYLSNALVYHFIPPERLTKTWLKKRHEAEGVGVAIGILQNNSGRAQRLFKSASASIMYIIFWVVSIFYPDKHFRFFAKMKLVYLVSLLKGLS